MKSSNRILSVILFFYLFIYFSDYVFYFIFDFAPSFYPFVFFSFLIHICILLPVYVLSHTSAVFLDTVFVLSLLNACVFFLRVSLELFVKRLLESDFYSQTITALVQGKIFSRKSSKVDVTVVVKFHFIHSCFTVSDM